MNYMVKTRQKGKFPSPNYTKFSFCIIVYMLTNCPFRSFIYLLFYLTLPTSSSTTSKIILYRSYVLKWVNTRITALGDLLDSTYWFCRNSSKAHHLSPTPFHAMIFEADFAFDVFLKDEGFSAPIKKHRRSGAFLFILQIHCKSPWGLWYNRAHQLRRWY